MSRIMLAVLLAALVGCKPASPPATGDTAPADPRNALIARGKSLELSGDWEPVPGNRLNHETAGFAKILCSAVFITGLEPADAAANVGGFTSPFETRIEVVDTMIDRANQTVRLTLKSGVVRVAKRQGSQGCTTFPLDQDTLLFRASTVKPNLPPAASTPWPMGDLLTKEPWPSEIDSAAFARAIDTAFGPADAMTLALVVTRKGRILAERYAPGIGPTSPLESWSMGKSLTGTLMGILIQRGDYQLEQPAPIPEWQGDARKEIRITDLMRMSSGIRIRAPQDPDYVDSLGYPDHLYLYTGGVNMFHYAATRPQQWKPNTVGRYRNTDPVLTNYLIRLAVEKRGENYHAFPQRALFDKLGIRNAVMETDAYGNFLTQGYEFLPARDWARLANLYLNDGLVKGERLLPPGYVDYVKTVAPAWAADGRPVYGGGFFWVNGDGGWPLPKDAFAMLGAGGQSAHIVPSHDLVIVRLGKYRGAAAADRALDRGLALLLSAVPATR